MFPHLSLAAARRFAPEGRRNFLIRLGDGPWGRHGSRGNDVSQIWIAGPIAALAIGVSLATFPAAAESLAQGCAQDLRRYRRRPLIPTAADTARTLKLAVDAFLAHPTDDNLRAARAAWIAARIPYMQTEAFRFGNPIVDDWEGRVNSWPLDEGLIDYVDTSIYGADSAENELYTANVIANKSLTIGGKKIDTSKITKELLANVLQEAGGVEANVATGYHAIEFMLWGQDLNGTGPGNGNRPATDYDHQELHPRQLRAPRRISPRRDRSPRR